MGRERGSSWFPDDETVELRQARDENKETRAMAEDVLKKAQAHQQAVRAILPSFPDPPPPMTHDSHTNFHSSVRLGPAFPISGIWMTQLPGLALIFQLLSHDLDAPVR